MSINYFGALPFENLMKAYNSLEKPTLIEDFNAAGIAFWEKTEVQNLTDILETRFEERAAFDFMIGFADNIEDDPGVIEKVDLTATVTADGKDRLIDSVSFGPITINE